MTAAAQQAILRTQSPDDITPIPASANSADGGVGRDRGLGKRLGVRAAAARAERERNKLEPADRPAKRVDVADATRGTNRCVGRWLSGRMPVARQGRLSPFIQNLLIPAWAAEAVQIVPMPFTIAHLV